jgi:hypothetical protein
VENSFRGWLEPRSGRLIACLIFYRMIKFLSSYVFEIIITTCIAVLLVLVFCTQSVYGNTPYTISGQRFGINYTGYDPTGQPGGPPGTPFTYEPIDGSSGYLKTEYVDAVTKYVAPILGRDMDWKYINDSTIQHWSQQQSLASDYTVFGMRETTDIHAANQFKAKIPDYSPQISIPLMSDDDYAYQQGKLWATLYSGKDVSINLGNEVWHVFQGNLGDWNLQQAKAEGYQGDDFRILGLRQGVRLAQHALKFMQGFSDGGGDPNRVHTIIEGFAPIAQYVQNQIDGMKSIGVDPKTIHATISIAHYAAGSDTDLQGALGTAAEKEASVMNFINAGPKVWAQQHLAIAIANGLDPHIGAYEFRLGTKPVTADEVADWVLFQNTDNEMRIQQNGIPTLLAASGGVGAIFNLEGYGGFPMDAPQGQFPEVTIAQMFNNPFESGVLRGTYSLIDFDSIPQTPEPSSIYPPMVLGVYKLFKRSKRFLV